MHNARGHRPVILGISGSFRQGSYNSAVLRACGELLGNRATLEMASLSDIPIYNEDDRPPDAFPPAVQALADAVRRCDAVLIATPEYNFSIPGGLKNALDWVSRTPEPPFRGKLVAVMSASTGKLGAARAQYHLRQVLQCLESRVICKPEVFVSDAPRAFSDGRLVDPSAREILARLLDTVLDAARQRSCNAVGASVVTGRA